MEEEVRRLRIANLHLEDSSRTLHSELIRVKATQDQEAQAEISRLSEAYALLERETAELRQTGRHLTTSSSDAGGSEIVGLVSRRLEAEQRLVKQLQDRLSSASPACPVDRCLRGDCSVADTAALLATSPVSAIIDQLAKVAQSEIFSPLVSKLADKFQTPVQCHDLLIALLPVAETKDSLVSLAQKCSHLVPLKLREFLLTPATDWSTCLQDGTSEISDVTAMFRLRCRPLLRLDAEYGLVQQLADFWLGRNKADHQTALGCLRLVGLLRGGTARERVVLLRCALEDGLTLLGVEEISLVAASVVQELSNRLATEIANIHQ